MRFISTSIIGTNALGEGACRKQAIVFDDLTLAMNPRWLNRVQPGAFGGQEKGQDAHALARLLDLLVVFADPVLDHLGAVPARVVERLNSQFLLPSLERR